MKENLTPLQYGELALRAIMNKYTPDKLPPEKALFYHQGVFLSGMQNVYFLTKNKEYFNYIKEYVDCTIGENGELYGVCHEKTNWKKPESWAEDINLLAMTMLDNKQPSILFYNLYDETGNEKYLNAAKTIGESMYFWPVNCYGGYWHMMTQPHQMWLDGAYMAGPLSVMYSDRFGDNTLAERAVNQILLMHKYMWDERTGLYYHGWDESKAMPWADKETGLSSQFWGRALGWYAVAILDILDYVPKGHPKRDELCKIEKDLLDSLIKFQDNKTGLWYQVVDRIDDDANWVESSGTCLFIYSYAKAIRMGVIEGEEYVNVLKKAYDGIVDRLYYDEDGNLIIDNICIGTCIDSGTYEHYISRAKINNDLHGSGAFVLMCAEMEKFLRFLENN